MKEIGANPELVAFCGLYCGARGSYLRERCQGCHKNTKVTWCKARSCCLEAGYSSCAECGKFTDPRDCKKFCNGLSKAIGLLLRSDRPACIAQIKALGLQGHANEMAAKKRQTIRP